MIHPFPKQVAIANCGRCGRTTFGHHVNRENEIPRRYCRLCASPLSVALYTFDRQLSEPPPDSDPGSNPIRSHPTP